MVAFLNALLLIVGIILIIVVILQPPKTDNAVGALSGSGVQVFGQTKERGAELFFKRLTIIFGTIFMILPIIIALLSK
ncbi:MAG: preprotein translocase subunit SecG [Bacilli bacterium]|jgi:preprotein translocase subunit SecG|nr:preprotein translocase subunit SecG [Bacilli bacterium]